MVQSNPWRYALFKTEVDQLIIEFNSLFIEFTVAFGNDARPGNRKPEIFDVQVLHQNNVLYITMIKTTTGMCTFFTGHGCKYIPDRHSFTVFKMGTFGLISG